MVINFLAAQLPGETAWLDAQVLLAHVTGHTRSWLLSHPETSLSPTEEQTIQSAIQQLQDGKPLPYVLGHWEFFGLDFIVTPDVLIPRPETELLIEYALGSIRSHPNYIYRIIDIGTGSGIIPVSLAVHVPQARLVATDISHAALKVARANAERQGVAGSIQFIQADLLPAEPAELEFDLICANLPYIPSETLKTLEIYGKEPTQALDGGIDGLDLIRRLLSLLSVRKTSDSLILLEIEERQGLAVSMLARASFPDAHIQIRKDLAGHDRLAIINT
jgi:release factor glutamine methyltransferase